MKIICNDEEVESLFFHIYVNFAKIIYLHDVLLLFLKSINFFQKKFQGRISQVFILL